MITRHKEKRVVCKALIWTFCLSNIITKPASFPFRERDRDLVASGASQPRFSTHTSINILVRRVCDPFDEDLWARSEGKKALITGLRTFSKQVHNFTVNRIIWFWISWVMTENARALWARSYGFSERKGLLRMLIVRIMYSSCVNSKYSYLQYVELIKFLTRPKITQYCCFPCLGRIGTQVNVWEEHLWIRF